MRGVVLSFVLLIAGCGGHSNVQLTASGSPATGVSTGGSVNVQGRSTFGALLAIGLLAGASYGSDRQYEDGGSCYRPDSFMPMQPTIPASAMDSSRSVNEQDCTKPIVDWSANLRCK